jgi:sugar O-acyltransferase (sialic acid O-acetyltransferase NeuD family)
MVSKHVKELLIIGAGGLARELADTVTYINAVRPTYRLIGFADDDEKLQATSVNGIEVIGGRSRVKELARHRAIAAVIAITNTAAKQALVAELNDSVKWETLVHPRALVSPSARIGQGTILQAGVIVAANATVGDHCIVNANSGLGHDTVMGDFCAIMSQCDVTGKARLGSAVFMGSGARILPGVVVGAGAKISAGAVVARDVEAGAKIAGNPARVIG